MSIITLLMSLEMNFDAIVFVFIKDKVVNLHVLPLTGKSDTLIVNGFRYGSCRDFGLPVNIWAPILLRQVIAQTKVKVVR